MAKETSRTFDPKLGAVIVVIQDDLGVDSFHTIHLTEDVDVSAMVAQLITESDERTVKLKARMIAAGWTPSP